jgi:hypothetical protein
LNIVEHDESGRILSVINYPTSDQAVSELEEYRDRLVLPQGYVIDWDRHYVADGEIAERPSMGAYLDGAIIKGVKSGASITIDGEKYEADGTDIELWFDRSGLFRISISLWPYADFEVTYENRTSVQL